MSLGIVVKGPEGLVLAADSRLTLTLQYPAGANQVSVPVSFDNARKIVNFVSPHNWFGAITFGAAAIGLRTASSFAPEIQSILPQTRQTVDQYAQLLSNFFAAQWTASIPANYQGLPMNFIVAGYNDGEAYGRVYTFDIPSAPTPQEMNPNDFGITWGGQRELVDRLMRGYDENALSIIQRALGLNNSQLLQMKQALAPLQMQFPVQVLALQDCIDLAIFFIRTTIQAQSLTTALRGVGGPIDVSVITRTQPFTFVQEKGLRGEEARR